MIKHILLAMVLHYSHAAFATTVPALLTTDCQCDAFGQRLTCESRLEVEGQIFGTEMGYNVSESETCSTLASDTERYSGMSFDISSTILDQTYLSLTMSWSPSTDRACSVLHLGGGIYQGRCEFSDIRMLILDPEDEDAPFVSDVSKHTSRSDQIDLSAYYGWVDQDVIDDYAFQSIVVHTAAYDSLYGKVHTNGGDVKLYPIVL